MSTQHRQTQVIKPQWHQEMSWCLGTVGNSLACQPSTHVTRASGGQVRVGGGITTAVDSAPLYMDRARKWYPSLHLVCPTSSWAWFPWYHLNTPIAPQPQFTQRGEFYQVAPSYSKDKSSISLLHGWCQTRRAIRVSTLCKVILQSQNGVKRKGTACSLTSA